MDVRGRRPGGTVPAVTGSSFLRRQARLLAGGAVDRAWRWASQVATITPDDPRGRAFQAMGAGSRIGFPPGPTFGERFIRIGSGVLMGPNVSLAVGMMPGEPLQVPSGVVITIGDRCVIGRGNTIVGRRQILIEDDVTTAPNVYITDHNHSYQDLEIPIGLQWPSEEPVRVGAGSWLGTNVVVLPGADIGRHVAVAAGSVVRGSIPDYSVIAGVPARVVRRYVEGEGWLPPLRHPVDVPEWWVVD